VVRADVCHDLRARENLSVELLLQPVELLLSCQYESAWTYPRKKKKKKKTYPLIVVHLHDDNNGRLSSNLSKRTRPSTGHS
jgi:hypothetical protein